MDFDSPPISGHVASFSLLTAYPFYCTLFKNQPDWLFETSTQDANSDGVLSLRALCGRNSLKFVPFKERKIIAADLRNIYSASSEEMIAEALEAFSKRWMIPIRDWRAAPNQFAILYGDREPL